MSHVLELHHQGPDRGRVVCRTCGELTNEAPLEFCRHLIEGHRRRHVTEPERHPWFRG